MLDKLTKQKIDTLRQILVGKLPDPKTQVEQITNALIYKFMDDMDSNSKKIGGKISYFSGEYEKYSWKNLLDIKLNGEDRVKLYSEALEKMNLNENLPALFREIFKNSVLPFKDSSLFLKFIKKIDEFEYTHSENLGDAYEYLLSYMGSQGDAGQFRTPRQIIDFIVGIVNPQKNESILDPACGTSGFLISSYNYILKQNTNKTLGDKLNISDINNIAKNLNGYDYSPDMVKMSLVNMFLHNFSNPLIEEYDTLSNDAYWNCFFNVILANPPFFSPNEGITPHNKFKINSSKAEVLFLSYIIDHLKPGGRAGIIIPNGIIQNVKRSGSYYLEIRNLLIKNGLYAIVSLPEGTFSPYSPSTKTSIVFLDKKLNFENILRIEVDNIGMNLGSQIYEIPENDLPKVSSIIKNYIQNRRIEKNNKITFQLIEKEKILNDEDVSVDLRKYVSNLLNYSGVAEVKKVGELFDIEKGLLPSSKRVEGQYNFITASDSWEKHNEYSHDTEALVFAFGAGGSLGRCHYVNGKFTPSNLCFVLKLKENLKNEFDLIYFQYYFKYQRSNIIKKTSVGTNKLTISLNYLSNWEIPLPNRNKKLEFMKYVNHINELENKKKLLSVEIDKFKSNELKEFIKEI